LRTPAKIATVRRILPPVPAVDRVLSALSRHSAILLLFMVCCGVAVIAMFMIRDLEHANSEAQEIFTGSVHGLERIGELQYEAQETRRATLYALTTTDSNLQVEYADQTRAADRRVTEGISEYRNEAQSAEVLALADRLNHDWITYLGVRDEVLASILEGSTQEAVSMDLKGGVPAFERVRKDLDEVKRLYAEDASRREADLAASARRTANKLVGITSFTFLLSTAAVWAIQRNRMLSRMQLAELQMEFVASVSHELRTPLAVIRSAADNLADGVIRDREAMLKYGAILQHQSRSMADLVDQILLFASTEDRTNRYILKPVSVERIIDAAVADTEAVLHGAGVTLDQEIDASLPPVMGDLGGISQCLQNLIGNAVKYGGDDRRITLRARRVNSLHGEPDELRISVADRGIGIDSSELGHIFDPFYRSPRVQAAQIHGTGLGLSLAKRIAESMGGRLTVSSQLAMGSTFTLHLQFAKGEDVEMAVAGVRQSRVSRT
jgi:signal transduction histidine kinase